MRIALVAASLEHVVRVAREVGALPEELGTIVDAVLSVAWSGRVDDTLGTQADDLGDRFSDELCTDLASLARAAAHLARGDVEGPRALNLLEDVVAGRSGGRGRCRRGNRLARQPRVLPRGSRACLA